MEIIKKTISENPSEYIEVCQQEQCKGIQQLKEKLKEVELLGGEGLMLRQPKSLYVAGRSNTLLKVKNFHDEEAKVIAHEPGKGKYSGLVGALWCEMANGKNFSVGSGLSDKDRVNPPKIGSIITFRYQELNSAGIPRFPIYVGVRIDAEWPKKTSTTTPVINPIKSKPSTYTPSESYIQGSKKKDKKSDKSEEKSDKSEKLKKKSISEKPEKKSEKPEKKSEKSEKPEKKSISEKPISAIKKPLQGYSFVFTGTHSVVRKSLQELVEINGGVFVDTVSKAINYLVATSTEVEVGTNKVVKASKYNLPIVSEDFLHNCIKEGKIIDHTPYILT